MLTKDELEDFFDSAFLYMFLEEEEDYYTDEFKELVKTKKPKMTLEEITKEFKNTNPSDYKKIIDDFEESKNVWLDEVKKNKEYYNSLKKMYSIISDEELMNRAFPYETMFVVRY